MEKSVLGLSWLDIVQKLIHMLAEIHNARQHPKGNSPPSLQKLKEFANGKCVLSPEQVKKLLNKL